MLFPQIIQQLYDYADLNGGKLKTQTFFILDEFANIGKIPDFDKKISTSRSRNISFSVILQNVDQLEAVYEKSYETIMGNCDTHVFLGSNSYRDSISINRDRQNWKTGKSVSDQAMARALMTPDELRRMDMDDCIIFVKGLKPVKTKKFYYFRKPMARELAAHEISHNDIGEIERGQWRKYNPYNPYVPEEDEEKKVENLKIESLDDLFEDIEEPKQQQNQEPELEPITVGIEKEKNKPTGILEEMGEAPVLPQQEDTYDLQKELEAKFDELFGPLDDNN